MAEIAGCPIVENIRLTDTAYAITMRAVGIAGHARAGQFVHVNCGHRRILRRPISICGADGDLIKIVFEARGEGTRWLAARRAGQSLDVLGPLGHGYDLSGENIIVLGGGIGVPPMLFAAKSAPGSVTAILGFRGSGKILLKEEFEATCKKVYITTDDGSFGIAGAVTLPLEKLLESGGYTAVLACGPRPMLKAAADLCARFDITCQVSLEERMGCGIGACFVCACKTEKNGEESMSRVCKDGPVFDAREVVW